MTEITYSALHFDHMVSFFIACCVQLPDTVSSLILRTLFKAQLFIEFPYHVVFRRRIIVSVNFFDSCFLTPFNKLIQHCKLHIPFQDATAHQPQADMRCFLFLLGDHNRNNAVIPELILQLSILGNIRIISRHLFYLCLCHTLSR